MENEVEKACPLLHQKVATPETVLKFALIHTNSKATPSQKESSSQGEERPMEKVEPATQDKLLNTPMEKLNIIPRNAANPMEEEKDAPPFRNLGTKTQDNLGERTQLTGKKSKMHNKRRRCHSVLNSISKRNLPKCTVKVYIPQPSYSCKYDNDCRYYKAF